MASFDPNTPLDDMELKFISRKLGLWQFITLCQILCIGTAVEDLVRQYKENVYAPIGMLFTWHSNQDPAKERSLMVNALNQSWLFSLAETIRMGYQHDATGNAVASNLNMGMESFDPNTPLNARKLDYISGLLSSIATSSQELTRQYMKNANAPSEMLNTWHSNQVPAEERSLMVMAMNKSGLCNLAKIVQRGECLRTVQQGMSTDQHHASFDPNTPLDARELDHISDHLCGSDVFSLSQSLRLETRLGYRYLAIRHKENADAPREMLNTWNTNQDPAKERRLLVKALNENWLCSLAETVRMGGWHALQLSAPYPSRPRKRTHTQTLAGHETNTPGASQPSSAPYPSRSCKQTQTQPLAGHETNTPGANQPSSAFYPSRPKVRTVANPPQQPDIVPMQIPQQTSYEITEIMLRDVSNKLGAEWRTVGTYLDFDNSQIEVMLEEYRTVKECIFQMLLKWRNSNGVEATKEKLKKALRRSYRADLTGFIDKSDD